MKTPTHMTRRELFEKLGKGGLVVGFSLSPVAASLLAEGANAASVDSSLTVLSGINPTPNDAWLTIDHQGNITLLSGRVELGTGTQTAFLQIVAEELYVDVSAITYVQGDTSRTNDQGFTAGSKSIQVQARSSAARRRRRSRRCCKTQPSTSVLTPANSWRRAEASGSVPG
jgi:CO/xanthine dehydrogenase Mo-binding subunit